MSSEVVADETQQNLRVATQGFDYLFSNDLQKARETFSAGESPFHQLGLGVCAFLEAALGMEVRDALIEIRIHPTEAVDRRRAC